MRPTGEEAGQAAGIIVCLEATASIISICPSPFTTPGWRSWSIRGFSQLRQALMKNSKTDTVDAETLAQYAERMDFVAWTRPSDERSPCAVSLAALMH